MAKQLKNTCFSVLSFFSLSLLAASGRLIDDDQVGRKRPWLYRSQQNEMTLLPTHLFTFSASYWFLSFPTDYAKLDN